MLKVATVKNIYDIIEKYVVIEMKEHTNKCVKEGIDILEEGYGKYFKEILKKYGNR